MVHDRKGKKVLAPGATDSGLRLLVCNIFVWSEKKTGEKKDNNNLNDNLYYNEK